MLSVVEILEVLLEAVFYFNTKNKKKSDPENNKEIQHEDEEKEESIHEIITEDRTNTPSDYVE
jgi:hypothetical protein